MFHDIPELIILQIVYVIILVLILWIERKKKRLRIAYWCIAALYIVIITGLINAWIRSGDHPDPGSLFGLGIASMILPGLLVLCAILIVILFRVTGKLFAKNGVPDNN